MYAGEEWFLRKDGTVFEAEVRSMPLLYDDLREPASVSLFRDVTQRKQAEAALHASQAFLDRTGRIGGVGGWAMDLTTWQIQWTDQTCRIHEREPGHRPSMEEALSYFAADARLLVEAAFKWCWQTGEAFDPRDKVQILGHLPLATGGSKLELVTLNVEDARIFQAAQGKTIRVRATLADGVLDVTVDQPRLL